MRKGLITVGVIAVLILLVYYGTVGYYNRFVSMEEKINESWAEVDNQLQRRNDLIPNLVETVKGFAAQEQQVFGQIAEARTKYAGAGSVPEKMGAANELSAALARLLVIVENYPELKSDQTFIRLMDELSGTENRIAVARMRYNEAVQKFNAAIRRFPGNMIAGYFNLEKAAYFEAPEEVKGVPEVEF